MAKPGDREAVLGLFPALETPGGVQVSGRVAWQSIVDKSRSVGRDAYLFCYGGKDRQGDQSRDSNCVRSRAKLPAAIAALRRRWPVRLVLVWHLALLRLLPFFRVPDARIAVFLHGIEAWRPQDWLTRAMLRRVDLFLSNSDYTWQRFLQANPEHGHAPHQTVPLGLASAVTDGIAAPASPPVVLMLSRLLKRENYKGHREMIHAWPHVVMRAPDAELWVAGDGDLRGTLEQLVARRGLQRTIRFLGRVSEAQKQELLTRCRCLALPSRDEGFGLVYLEAMRLGRPCLVGAAGAGCEVVKPPEAGLAADVSEPHVLAAAVDRLLRPGPEWDAWSQRARERYEAHFTAERFQQRLLGALIPLLG